MDVATAGARRKGCLKEDNSQGQVSGQAAVAAILPAVAAVEEHEGTNGDQTTDQDIAHRAVLVLADGRQHKITLEVQLVARMNA